MPRKQTPMAIIYDFDGTLAPGNVQEHRFIPDIGMKVNDFWNEVNRIAKEQQADSVLVYMHLMLKKASEAKVSVRLEDFQKQGEALTFFEGVESWFDRINTMLRVSRSKSNTTSCPLVTER